MENTVSKNESSASNHSDIRMKKVIKNILVTMLVFFLIMLFLGSGIGYLIDGFIGFESVVFSCLACLVLMSIIIYNVLEY